MKKITLIVASIFLAGSMAKASENPVFSDNTGKGPERIVHYNEAEPIQFNERGIEFFVFPNGDFDFNTRPEDSHGDYYFKAAGKKGAVVVERGGPINYGVRIERDAFGRVRRVGNTFINYDAFDRVNRIGTVFMRYNSFALTQIGGLRIVYNRRGEIIDMFGTVKGCNGYYGTYNGPRYNDYPRNDYPRNDYPRGDHGYNDDDYYYYKQDGTKAKVEETDKEKREDDSQK